MKFFISIQGCTVQSMSKKRVVTHPVNLYCLDFGPIKGKIYSTMLIKL